jgi:hypothetical protein
MLREVVIEGAGHNGQVQFPHLFAQLRLLGHKVGAIYFLAQGVGHNIGFTRRVMNFHVIVLDQLQPSSLS